MAEIAIEQNVDVTIPCPGATHHLRASVAVQRLTLGSPKQSVNAFKSIESLHKRLKPLTVGSRKQERP